MSLTTLGIESRDSEVLSKSRDAGVPVAGVMTGSYARCIEDGVAVHVNIVRLACRVPYVAFLRRAPRALVITSSLLSFSQS